jgi:hypothetical protein
MTAAKAVPGPVSTVNEQSVQSIAGLHLSVLPHSRLGHGHEPTSPRQQEGRLPCPMFARLPPLEEDACLLPLRVTLVVRRFGLADIHLRLG